MSDSQFAEKLIKKLPKEFDAKVDGCSKDEIDKLILESEATIYAIEKEMDADEKLNAAKSVVKEFSKDYRDKKSTEMAKIKYCLWVLEGRGQA